MDEKLKLEKVKRLEKDIHSLECNLLEKKAALLKMDTIEDNDERIHKLEEEIKLLSSSHIFTAKDLSMCVNNEGAVYVADSIFYELLLTKYILGVNDVAGTLKLVPSDPHIGEVLCKELKNFAINIRTNLIAELVADNAKCLADIDSAISGGN